MKIVDIVDALGTVCSCVEGGEGGEGGEEAEKKEQEKEEKEEKEEVERKKDEEEVIEFRFARFIGQRRALSFEFVVGVLLSSTTHHDLHALNPYLTPKRVQRLSEQTVGLLMR